MIGHPNLALFIVLSAAAAVSSLPASFQLINFGGKSTFQNTGFAQGFPNPGFGGGQVNQLTNCPAGICKPAVGAIPIATPTVVPTVAPSGSARLSLSPEMTQIVRAHVAANAGLSSVEGSRIHNYGLASPYPRTDPAGVLDGSTRDFKPPAGK